MRGSLSHFSETVSTVSFSRARRHSSGIFTSRVQEPTASPCTTTRWRSLASPPPATGNSHTRVWSRRAFSSFSVCSLSSAAEGSTPWARRNACASASARSRATVAPGASSRSVRVKPTAAPVVASTETQYSSFCPGTKKRTRHSGVGASVS